MTVRTPIILDVDTGIDDAMALLYACGSPDAELVAVTCVSGNVAARQVAENTRALLELVGRGDVEVALGREVPLCRPLMTSPETHGPRGIGYATLPPAMRPVSSRHAADLIVSEARRRPGEVTLVAVGPQTNIAVALQREPALPGLLRRFVFMGGAFRAPGNTTPVSEWNVAVDPDAAKAVADAFGTDDFRASERPRPLALGLDVTEQAIVRPADLDRLYARAGGTPDSDPVLRFIADALRFYIRFHEQYDGFSGAHMHDPLALATALDPSLVATQPVTVDVELTGALTGGQTVADWRHHWGRPPNMDVAISVRGDDFLERFIERVGALAAACAAVRSGQAST
ncbi:MAG TPA: nucleoside hydrolase [Candidatus Sulfotelmatobacter sp.]|nr:nucleoside hydrolase [Candidatus Sulfotelmatobacter sp.]